MLLGYGGALESKAQLFTGCGIDFLPKGSAGSVSGQAWGWDSWGLLPGDSALSRALEEKPLGGRSS